LTEDHPAIVVLAFAGSACPKLAGVPALFVGATPDTVNLIVFVSHDTDTDFAGFIGHV